MGKFASHNVSTFPVYLHSHVSIGLTDVLQAAGFCYKYRGPRHLCLETMLVWSQLMLPVHVLNSISSDKYLLLIICWNSKTTHGWLHRHIITIIICLWLTQTCKVKGSQNTLTLGDINMLVLTRDIVCAQLKMARE